MTRYEWTTKEIAAAAGVTEGYIRRLLGQGRLKGYKKGRDWLIPDEEAQRWLEERAKRLREKKK